VSSSRDLVIEAAPVAPQIGLHLRYYRTMKLRSLLWMLLVGTVVLGADGAPSLAAGKPVAVVKQAEVTLVGRFVEADQEILALRPKATMPGIVTGARISLEQPAGRPAPWSSVVYEQAPGVDQLLLVRRRIPAPGIGGATVRLVEVGSIIGHSKRS
jgi:hypothetical protein